MDSAIEQNALSLSKMFEKLSLNPGKENIENQDPGVKLRGRKNVDSGLDRPRGLKENEAPNKATMVKRRTVSFSEANDAAPNFQKTTFRVYGDDSGLNHKNITEEIDSKITPAVFQSKDTSRGPPQIVKKSIKRGRVTSPKSLLHIPPTNVLKIKEEHNRSAIKKSHRTFTDVLSTKLAYNIEYRTEYMEFQMEMDNRRRLSANFLTKNIKPIQRRFVVKYLVSVTTYFRFSSFLLYEAVKILDFYIDKVRVGLDRLQLSSLAALWIAVKKDAMVNDIPTATDLIELVSNPMDTSIKDLAEIEKDILITLNFEVSFAEPFSIVALYTIIIEDFRSTLSMHLQKIYYSSSYLIDLSILHHKICDVSAVHLATLSIEIVLTLVTMEMEKKDFKSPNWSYWRNRVLHSNPILQKYCLSDLHLDTIRMQLLQIIGKSMDSTSDYNVVYKKYKKKRYGNVSEFITSMVTKLLP